jgi:hypothetical protein
MSTTTNTKRWAKEEDELSVKGVAQFGKQAWAKIMTHFLSWRNTIQISQRYGQLDPHIKKEKWTEDELALLSRRTIIYRQA